MRPPPCRAQARGEAPSLRALPYFSRENAALLVNTGGNIRKLRRIVHENSAVTRNPRVPSPPLCSLFNNVVMPSQLPMGADMHLFRDGIAPKVRLTQI